MQWNCFGSVVVAGCYSCLVMYSFQSDWHMLFGYKCISSSRIVGLGSLSFIELKY